MTILEAHALAVAVDERRAHLARCIALYGERGWLDLAAEYRVRLEELERVVATARAAPESEGELRAAFGDR